MKRFSCLYKNRGDMPSGFYFSYEFLSKKSYINDLIKSIKNTFYIFFIFIIVESFIDNFIAVNFVRNVINNIFAAGDRTYIIAEKRYGIYSAYGLFSEPSYVGSIMIIFYSIMYVGGLKSIKERLFFFLSFIVIILSGSSVSFLMIPLGILVVIKNYLKINKEIMIKIVFIIVSVPIAVYIVTLISNSGVEMIEYTINKLLAYFGGNRIDGSGYSRSFGNRVCYNVFRVNPIFGVGLGTTRGFGIIPGLVANLGIAGVISYILFIKNNLNICITKNNFFIFVIFIIYLTSIFSIWHIYTPIMIALVLFMNKTLIKEK